MSKYSEIFIKSQLQSTLHVELLRQSKSNRLSLFTQTRVKRSIKNRVWVKIRLIKMRLSLYNCYNIIEFLLIIIC